MSGTRKRLASRPIIPCPSWALGHFGFALSPRPSARRLGRPPWGALRPIARGLRALAPSSSDRRGLLRLADLDGLGLEGLDLDARASCGDRPRSAARPRRALAGPRPCRRRLLDLRPRARARGVALTSGPSSSSPSPRSFQSARSSGRGAPPRSASRSTVAPAANAASRSPTLTPGSGAGTAWLVKPFLGRRR